MMNVDDLTPVLSEAEIAWLDNLRIPYAGGAHLWAEKHRLDALVMQGIKDGRLKQRISEHQVWHGPQIISDYIDGPMGALLNHADGKMYDSKSQYYRAVKAAGCVVMGTDAPTTAKEPDYKICDKDLGRDIKQAIEQLGG